MTPFFPIEAATRSGNRNGNRSGKKQKNAVHPANEYLQYFSREDAKTRSREEREAEEQRQGAGSWGFLVLRLLRFPLLATQLPGNAFDLLPLLRILA
jgi:hypothetical protein